MRGMDGWIDGWMDGGTLAYARRLLLIIFRAHRRNTHPVVASALSLTLLAFRTRHKKEIGCYKKSDVIM